MDFEYDIGGRKFKQKPLVLGQVKQLIAVLKGLVLPSELNVMSLIESLDEKITQALAILLIENGVSLKEKNVSEVQEFLDENLELKTIVGVINDFFDCNPIASISEALIGLTTKIQEKMYQTTLLTKSVPSLPKEILPKEMISSGDTPLESANPI